MSIITYFPHKLIIKPLVVVVIMRGTTQYYNSPTSKRDFGTFREYTGRTADVVRFLTTDLFTREQTATAVERIALLATVLNIVEPRKEKIKNK